MDKYEYKVRSEEIVKLIEEEKYEEAVVIADLIDWRRVKSLTMLLRVAALYRVNRRQEDCRAILLLAYDRYPTNRSVVNALCEVSIELDDVVAAIEYYKEFVKLAPRDNGVFTLRYRILEAQEASLEERIELLEELKKRDYQEEWAYELAYLYHRVGLATKCVEECDDLILWFGDGPYVMKAMELKMLHAPLTAIQEKNYQNMLQEVKGIPEDEAYTQQDSYEEEPYYPEETVYPEDGYAQEYNENGYEQSYSEDTYTQGYEQGYPEDTYAQGYEQSYSEDTYAQGYEQGYPEDTYAQENENVYPEEDNAGEMYRNDSSVINQNTADNGNAYRDNSYADMSQYNTINLQKVVAESMKELFPEESDILEENKREVERIENASGKLNNKVPVPVLVQQEESTEESEPSYVEKSESETEEAITADIMTEDTMEEVHEVLQEIPKESKIDKILTGVSEIEPEPNAGAIKKVILPGNVQMSGSTYEEKIQDSLGETQEEPLYETVKSEDEEVPFRPMTGQMNIEDVLLEWERLKKENEEKRREEVKQLVIQQTGQLFVNFEEACRVETILDETDESVTSEVEELEEEPNSESQEVSYEEEMTYEEPEAESYEEEMTYEEPEAESYEEETTYEEPEAESYEEEMTYEEPEAESYEEEMTYEEPEAESYEEETTYEEPETESYEEEMTYEEPETEQAEMVTQEISMDTEEISSLPERIIATTKKETKGAKREELREFTPEEQELFDDFAVTKKIKRQILETLDNMTLASYTGNVLVTGEAGLGTVRLSKYLIKEFKNADANFSGKVAKITGEQLNKREMKDVFDKLKGGALIVEAANGMTENTLYEMAMQLNQEDFGIIVFLVDTKKGISKLLEKQAMLADYFTCRIDLIEMDNNALVAYAKSYAMALEYSIDDLGTLALYTRITNIQSGNHIVTKDEVRDIIDEAIHKSKKFKIKNLVDVIFAKRYDKEDMIVLKERDFM